MNRILAWLNSDYAQTTTYQQAQGQLAIASGGLFGQGFLMSPLILVPRTGKLWFYGRRRRLWLVGASVLLILYVTLICNDLKIYLPSPNPLYTYIYRIIMLVFSYFENVGAATLVFPFDGDSLPLSQVWIVYY